MKTLILKISGKTVTDHYYKGYKFIEMVKTLIPFNELTYFFK